MNAKDLMTALITLEGLLFTGLAAGIGVSASSQGLKSRFASAKLLARLAASGLSIVAVGALAAFLTVVQHHHPRGVGQTVATACLGLGILMDWSS
jgi:hypothetical protein